MKVLRYITFVLFIIMVAAYIMFSFYKEQNTDTTRPSIILPDELLEVSISSDDKELLQGVTAFDQKDGDLTDRIIVESISPFVNEGVCIATYAVSDFDCHVAKATRVIRYTDYTSPKFYLRRPLVFSVGEKIDFRNIIGATDCLDGDISNKIAIVSSDYTSTTVGVYTVSLQVANSHGDIVYSDFPVYVEQTTNLAPNIILSENIIYIKKGETPDYDSFVLAVYQSGAVLEDGELVYSADFDTNIPGMYSVHYYATNAAGFTGHTILTVVVEE